MGSGINVLESAGAETAERAFAGSRPLSPWLLQIPFPTKETHSGDSAVPAVQ